MSYDLIGDDDLFGDDDEFEGSIGDEVDFIEGDDDLLNALAISGDSDLFGDDDFISGAGDTEIVGAKRRGSAARRRASLAKRRAALRRRIAQRDAGLVRKVGLASKRRNPLGFVPTDIAAGITVQVPSAPQNLFRAERLVIPSDISFEIGIADIKIGNVSQLVQSAELPAAIFSEVAIDTQVSFDTAEIGNQISVNARNKSGAVIEFTAALLGTIAKR